MIYTIDLKFFILGVILGILFYPFRKNTFNGYVIGKFDIMFLERLVDKNKFYFKYIYLNFETKNKLKKMRKSFFNTVYHMVSTHIISSRVTVRSNFKFKGKILKTLYFKEYSAIITINTNQNKNNFFETLTLINLSTKEVVYHNSYSIINGKKKEFTYIDPDINMDTINKFPFIGDFKILKKEISCI